jgi:glycerate kinase
LSPDTRFFDVPAPVSLESGHRLEGVRIAYRTWGDGTTAGLLGLTRATVRPGVEVVAELVGLADALEAADLVITGEGRADEQTLQGKTAIGVAILARPRNTPVALLCGGLGPGAEALDAAMALTVVQPIVDRPMDLPDAMADTERLLQAAAGRLARSIGIGLGLTRA